MLRSFFLLSLISLFVSCSQFAWKAKYKPEYLGKLNEELKEKLKKGDIEEAKKNNSKLKVTLVQEEPENHFAITNNYGQPIKVSYNDSSLIWGNESFRVVSGETRQVLSELNVPDLTVPPNATARFSFYSPKRFFNDNYDKAIIAIKVEGKTFSYYYIKPPTVKTYAEYHSPIKDSDKNLCYLTAILWGGYCWFIRPDDKDEKTAKDNFMKDSGLNDNQFDWVYSHKH